MIEVKHLTKSYRDLVAVDDLTFRVEKGEILGFLGPNGAGKSTTMRILTGFLPPTSGTASVAGHDVFEEPLEVKRRVGYLPEIPPVYPEMSVRAYLSFVAEIKGVPGKIRKGEVERVAAAANVSDVLGRVIGNMSKGYRQRVGIAQALIGSPDVLVLDEPTAGLDPSQILEVRALLRALAGRHTVIVSTHILQEVTATCDKVLIIARGRLVAHERLTDLQVKHPGKSLDEIFLSLTHVVPAAPEPVVAATAGIA